MLWLLPWLRGWLADIKNAAPKWQEMADGLLAPLLAGQLAGHAGHIGLEGRSPAFVMGLTETMALGRLADQAAGHQCAAASGLLAGVVRLATPSQGLAVMGTKAALHACRQQGTECESGCQGLEQHQTPAHPP